MAYFWEYFMKERLKGLLRKLRNLLETAGERVVRSKLSALQELSFFHSLHFGATGHDCAGWKSVDGVFHSDAPIAIVVTRGGKVSGVVGFEIIGSTMLVRQLQGAPRGNFHDGIKAEEYLLNCAETIAEALEVKHLRIVTPETAIAYRRDAPTEWRPSPKAEEHMTRIYSYPARVGYKLRFFWRLRRPTFYRSLS